MDETNTAVIARLDRATQYSQTPAIESRSRGVLDRPVKPGDDSFVMAARASYLTRFLAGFACARNDELKTFSSANM
jgi:hypothetical protein